MSSYTPITGNEGPKESLIQYGPPIESSISGDEQKEAAVLRKKLNLQALESKPSIEEILNALLPPREWEQEGKHFIQYASHKPSSREDVANLQKLLDERLVARQARESGICPIREELHSQCFDEIIRQVTIDCPERGLLLMRVRDELKMTIAAYQTLYQSSVAFGVRKQLQSEQGKSELENKVTELEARKAALEDKKTELTNKKESLEKRIQERKAIEEAKREKEFGYLKNQQTHLDEFIKSISSQIK